MATPLHQVSRARERGSEDFQKMPRGCATGCVPGVLQVMWNARYAMALFLVSMMEGHTPPGPSGDHVLYRSPTVAAVSSGSSVAVSTAAQTKSPNAFVQQKFKQWMENPGMLEKAFSEENMQKVGLTPLTGIFTKDASNGEALGIAGLDSSVEVTVIRVYGKMAKVLGDQNPAVFYYYGGQIHEVVKEAEPPVSPK